MIKEIRRAARRGGLTEGGFALAESPHLLQEAIAAGLPVHATLISEKASETVQATAGALHPSFHTIPENLFAELSSTESSQGLLSLVQLPSHEWDNTLHGARCIVILDGVQDPGNVGTIIRTAEAFGADGILFGHGTASPSNPKTLRASAGSLFRMPFVRAQNSDAVIEAVRSEGLSLVAATAHDGEPLNSVNLRQAAIVIGSEGHGVSERYLEAAEAVHIPVAGVESLNAAAAAAVLLYVAAEQRSTTR